MRRNDPLFQDVPWEFIYNDNGELIGEVYLTLPEPLPRRGKGSWLGTTSTLPRKNMKLLKS